MELTLGGDRLGSGNKNKIYLHNYERSTHDLSQRFTSTMGVGMCVPCLVIPALRGDVFDININGACRTIPTKAPLFSTFKMQVDIFECAVRLYQAILHNNPLFIGLKMKDVKFPILEMKCELGFNGVDNSKCADTSLMKYLGLSGMGHFTGGAVNTTCIREINAIPMLAYYDICKTYYSNKQETNAYYCGTKERIKNEGFQINDIYDADETSIDFTELIGTITTTNGKVIPYDSYTNLIDFDVNGNIFYFELQYDGHYGELIAVKSRKDGDYSIYTIADAATLGIISYSYDVSTKKIRLQFVDSDVYHAQFYWQTMPHIEEEVIAINSFPLENIDKMRLAILSSHTLGTAFKIQSTNNYEPYNKLADKQNGKTTSANDLFGLFIKTYQADLFNAWVNTEWIDGENGIAEMSKIAVSDGAVYMDALLLAEKTYNMLNRIAVAGGTYEDWQNVVYTESSRKHIESPIYCGGLSNEIVFEEIVQTTPTEGAPLGTLGGRGIAVKRKGGNVSIKCDEASYIIGIVSITPRVYYTQGNEFYMTELKSMDDMHKPALDGIGFQDLLAERLVWSANTIASGGSTLARPKVGKVPAWIEYMTAVDKAYGEFCDINKQGFMILGRHYETDENGQMTDATTYVDPSKFNYAFGKDDLLAQNFWVQIDFDIKARRLMSAKQIPNL